MHKESVTKPKGSLGYTHLYNIINRNRQYKDTLQDKHKTKDIMYKMRITLKYNCGENICIASQEIIGVESTGIY